MLRDIPLWNGDHDYTHIFGSGTPLYVTDEPVVKPKVSVYPASRAGLEGKSSLLCVARSMFPPLVQFVWKKESNGRAEGEEEGKREEEEEELPEGNQVELRESGHAAAILLIDPERAKAYKYRCYVKHEGGTVEAPPTAHDPPVAAPTCPPEGDRADPPPDVSFRSQCRVALVSLVYTGMIVKSAMYCCGLSVLIIHRNKGRSATRRRGD